MIEIPLDFFLWGYIKSKVYTTPPPNLQVLQNRIENDINALRRERMTRRAFANMWERARRCLNLHGAQVEGRAGH